MCFIDQKKERTKCAYCHVCLGKIEKQKTAHTTVCPLETFYLSKVHGPIFQNLVFYISFEESSLQSYKFKILVKTMYQAIFAICITLDLTV